MTVVNIVHRYPDDDDPIFDQVFVVSFPVREETPMAYAAEVIADGSGKWVGNALVFATEAEALAYVADLARRWTLVRQIRVVETSDPVNSTWPRAS